MATRWFDRLNGPVLALSLIGFASVLIFCLSVYAGTVWAVLFALALVLVVFVLMILALADAKRAARREHIRFAVDAE